MPHRTLLELETLDAVTVTTGELDDPRAVLVTVLGHPDADRVGEVAWLPGLLTLGGEAQISRGAPEFHPPRGPGGGPLLSPFVSRKALTVRRADAGHLEIDPGKLAGRVRADGVSLERSRRLPLTALDAGVVLRLGTHVVLLLHAERDQPPPPEHGMVGESAALQDVRRAIDALADAPGAVLIRGSTGAGKELVAAALHRASRRAGRDFLAVNMAAVPVALAASELFGHTRGAFSGAGRARDGHFVAAHLGTLFLDEVGDTPDPVQAALLRVMETGEVRPVGADRARTVDVRLIAATDADLDGAVAAGRFRGPLLYRLAANTIHLPTLTERRADIGRLLVHFLDEELSRLGRAALLHPEPTEQRVWLSADVVERLARYRWPGNVRELRNVARALAMRSGEPAPLRADDPALLRLLSAPAADPPAPPPAAGRPGAVTDEMLEAVLAEEDYKLGAAAARLGISRPALNDRVDAHPSLKRAIHLTDEELAAGEASAAASGEPLWRVLKVSRRGLVRRIRGVDKA
jgi:two-component system nitrogen regulation response regulator GlnG